MRDGGLVAQPGVGPSQLGRDVRVAHGEALDVDFVDDRVGVQAPGPLVVVPGELRVHDQAAGHVPGGVQGARLGRVGRVLAEHLGPERDRPGHRLGVGVEQQLGRVAPQAPVRVPGAADPVPVGLARADAGHERMPDVGVIIRDRDLGFGAGRVEQAQRDTIGDGRGDREVRARHCPARSPGVAPSGNGQPGSAVPGRASGAVRAAGTAPAAVAALLVVIAVPPVLLCRAGRLPPTGPRRGGAGSHQRSGRSSRSGGRRRSRRRCRRGSTR